MHVLIDSTMSVSQATAVVVFDILLLLFIAIAAANIMNALSFMRRRYLRGKRKY